MTNQDNVEIIVSKMLNTLHASTDHHFRNDLVLKITELAERFSTTHKWYLETMQIYIRRAGIEVKGATENLKLIDRRAAMGRVMQLFKS